MGSPVRYFTIPVRPAIRILFLILPIPPVIRAAHSTKDSLDHRLQYQEQNNDYYQGHKIRHRHHLFFCSSLRPDYFLFPFIQESFRPGIEIFSAFGEAAESPETNMTGKNTLPPEGRLFPSPAGRSCLATAMSGLFCRKILKIP